MAEETNGVEGVEVENQAAPTIDPRDEEIKQLKMNFHVMGQALETNNQLLQGILQGRGGNAGERQPVQKKDITEEELEAAFQEGKGAAKLKEYMGRMAEDLVQTHIAPLRQTGMAAIGETIMEIMKPQMPFYDRFKKEITNFLEMYPPDLKVNRQAIKAAYDTVVGAHFNELAEEKVQQEVRKASGLVVTPKTSGRGRGREEEVPDAESLAPGALSGVGRSEEEFARKLGYKSWADYQKVGTEIGQ